MSDEKKTPTPATPAVKPTIAPTATLGELRDKARGVKDRPVPTKADVAAAVARITKACEGKPRGVQLVETGKKRDGSSRYGNKQYAAQVIAGDTITLGDYLKKTGRHDDRTSVLYAGACGAKKNTDGTPRMVYQLVDELDHLLEVVAHAEREDR